MPTTAKSKLILETIEQYADFHKVYFPGDWTHLEHDVRNETLEEVARVIASLPLGGDTAETLAAWIRQQKSGPDF
jgi:hypothetical protein